MICDLCASAHHTSTCVIAKSIIAERPRFTTPLPAPKIPLVDLLMWGTRNPA